MRTKTQLISDSYSLAQARRLDADVPLDLVKFLSKELDYLPWNMFITRIRFYIDMLDSTQYYGSLQSYLASLVKNYYNKFGWENDLSQSWLDRYKNNF